MPIDESLMHFPGPSDPDSRFDYHCGHCDREVTGRVMSIYFTNNSRKDPISVFLLCPSCIKGSIWMKGNNIIIPGAKPGDRLQGLPQDINKFYEEARICFANNAFTATELLCRKLLMHIAVDKGANEGESFKGYIDYLEEKGFITPPIKNWADLIRTHGNYATHRMEAPSKDRTETTFMFLLQILRIIYEMDFKASQFNTKE